VTEALNPEPQDVAARLAALDLQIDDLLGPVRLGAAARRTATAHHPKAYGGWRDYGERVAGLRDQLADRGWTAEEVDGVCMTVHPNRRLALMTALGNSGTGTASPVSTQRKRGDTTEKVVRVNAQLAFDFEVDEPPPALRETLMPTWVLLVHTDGDQVRSELSLARHMDEDGFIDAWLERIPLPIIQLNDTLDVSDDDEGGPASGIDFEVPER
jgi:hypothetical protein